ncbi:MAG: YggS family pyridoxal phosphate-dependent enzyme [Phycisphaerae bacterium]|nr:YggS family pyridoxal phosphate-dependent enzyme [Phycisphaerae bacterium]|tara:strand:- start:5407 stop:6183 length:777 start_codon:yes stop_codon:yes gene_type:complete
MDGESTRERYLSVCRRIDEAKARAGRENSPVHLVAVTKYAAMEQVRELIELGHVDFGEGRAQHFLKMAPQVQEFLDRRKSLGESNGPDSVRWHFIGHLQRNKAKKLLPLVRMIHSVDSLRLAEEIQSCTENAESPVEVLVQINPTDERKRYGIAPAAVRHLIEQIETMITIRVRGIMTMAPKVDDPEEVRPIFTRVNELFQEIRRSGVGGEHFDILSMGMSNDFEVAIECGANIVRVGTAIFGEKETAEAISTEQAEA